MKYSKFIIASLCLLVGAMLLFFRESSEYYIDGCEAYIESEERLVAHAGGGLPDAIYGNNLEAITLAIKHGFQLIEIDFLDVEGQIRLGHGYDDISNLSVEALVEVMRAHPSVSIVTDFKTDNISGLKALKPVAGDVLDRFIPQIYSPSEYQAVADLGYPAPILTIYRLGSTGWQAEANELPLHGVTMPYEARHLADGVNHFVYLHTVNEPVSGFGLYTDCLIPKPM